MSPAVARARLRFGAIGRVSRASAAGISWTSRTLARASHTSVVDAAGAIYVIGGANGDTFYQDVWVSADGGAQAGLGRGRIGGCTKGVLREYSGYWEGTRGYQGGTTGILRGYQGFTRGVLGIY